MVWCDCVRWSYWTCTSREHWTREDKVLIPSLKRRHQRPLSITNRLTTNCLLPGHFYIIFWSYAAAKWSDEILYQNFQPPCEIMPLPVQRLYTLVLYRRQFGLTLHRRSFSTSAKFFRKNKEIRKCVVAPPFSRWRRQAMFVVKKYFAL